MPPTRRSPEGRTWIVGLLLVVAGGALVVAMAGTGSRLRAHTVFYGAGLLVLGLGLYLLFG